MRYLGKCVFVSVISSIWTSFSEGVVSFTSGNFRSYDVFLEIYRSVVGDK